MLSILIPTYNCDCLRLATDLQQQCEETQAYYGATQFDYEIIIGDDASTDETVTARNELAELLPNCRVMNSTPNLGRARICNRLMSAAAFPHLLLIDADAEVCTDNFIHTYWTRRNEADVVVGSIRTPHTAPQGHELRLKYEHAAEAKRSAAYRNAHPTENFSTFNILFSRRVVETVRFDERCVEYGYEDALMGIEIARNGYSILHIDNPLLHTGINNNLSFLANTEASLRTLARLGSPIDQNARIARAHQAITRHRLLPLLHLFFRIFHPLLRRQLLSRRPSLLLFNLYKLGYYATLLAPTEGHSAATAFSSSPKSPTT